MKSRINKLQRKLRAENLDVLLVTELSHIRYLTGFHCTELLDGIAIVTQKEAHLFTDFRYKEQAKEEVDFAKIHVGQRNALKDLPDFEPLQENYIKIGFESDHLPHSKVSELKHLFKKAVFIPTTGLIEEQAMVKESSAISKIKGAVKISDKAFERILGMIEPGIREEELAAELEYQMKMLGSEKPAFETIVASGYRSSMPHGVASSKEVEKGDFITFDFGATYQGYTSDITRTVVVGKATKKQKRVYDTVLKAQLKAIRAAKAGITGEKLDKVARDHINKAKFGKYFGHGLGHGIGLLVHEGPRVSPTADNVLEVGNVVTIEPGIYIPDWGGVRIEDDVVIKKNGCTVLNKAPKELIEL